MSGSMGVPDCEMCGDDLMGNFVCTMCLPPKAVLVEHVPTMTHSCVTQCPSPLVNENGVCRIPCNYNEWRDGEFCVPCHPTCGSCSSFGSDMCETCAVSTMNHNTNPPGGNTGTCTCGPDSVFTG